MEDLKCSFILKRTSKELGYDEKATTPHVFFGVGAKLCFNIRASVVIPFPIFHNVATFPIKESSPDSLRLPRLSSRASINVFK